MLKFTTISNVTVGQDGSEKKYVLYRLSICLDGELPDKNPSYIQRRYTNFLDLYNKLRKDFPSQMSTVNFPKKVMVGNFDDELINRRYESFVSFLDHIAKESRLRDAACTISFFHKIELDEAEKLMSENKYNQAMIILENIFTLLNKIYTNHAYVVLVALCRLVACGTANKIDSSEGSASFAGPSERWADLALQRFESVCDTDILSLYVPLIKTCIFIRKTLGKEIATLENKLQDMRKRGIRVDNNVSLMEAIHKLEQSSDIYLK